MANREMTPREIEDMLDACNERFRLIETVLHELLRVNPGGEHIATVLQDAIALAEAKDLASDDSEATLAMRRMFRQLTRRNIIKPGESDRDLPQKRVVYQ